MARFHGRKKLSTIADWSTHPRLGCNHHKPLGPSETPSAQKLGHQLLFFPHGIPIQPSRDCCWLNLHFPWLNPCISSMVKSFIKPYRIVTLRNRSFPHGLPRNMEIHPSTGRCEAMRSLDLLPSSAGGSSGFCLLGPMGLSDNGVNPQRCWLVV